MRIVVMRYGKSGPELLYVATGGSGVGGGCGDRRSPTSDGVSANDSESAAGLSHRSRAGKRPETD